ncbi:hypothetical protein CKO28_26835 [Rhodovibrio sodomensis]|uniref:FAD/NAD(P)-binding domain-containing protein n=1 Tax=Rhodovibrio sodomensis TaxID=1088 RepID=A0ABS1DNC5_9PROT|nr:hypothetical protein [Rhodovibrio sodomensis]
MPETVDIAVIGAGTAGMAAYRKAREASDNVALIEGGQYGTTCAMVGCMPSKLLIAAAERADAVRDAAGFGVQTGGLTIDGKAVMERVRDERDRFVGLVRETVEGFDPAHRVTGHATFADPHTIALEDGTRLQADRVVVATGSRPVWPSAFEHVGDRLVVNDDIFDWTDLPNSVAVFGGGIIGLELGQALARLGVRVRIFGKGGSVANLTDPVVKARAVSAINKTVPFDPDADVSEIVRDDDAVSVTFAADDDGRRQTHASLRLPAGGDGPETERGQAGDRPVRSRPRHTRGSHIRSAHDAGERKPHLHGWRRVRAHSAAPCGRRRRTDRRYERGELSQRPGPSTAHAAQRGLYRAQHRHRRPQLRGTAAHALRIRGWRGVRWTRCLQQRWGFRALGGGALGVCRRLARGERSRRGWRIVQPWCGLHHRLIGVRACGRRLDGPRTI